MKKVLIVDDSATIRKQVRAALSEAPFDVIEASDGVEGAATINLSLIHISEPTRLGMISRL